MLHSVSTTAVSIIWGKQYGQTVKPKSTDNNAADDDEELPRWECENASCLVYSGAETCPRRFDRFR